MSLFTRLRHSRPATLAATVAGALALTAAATLAGTVSADANPPARVDPHGAVVWQRPTTGHVNATGWAYDPSARTSNLSIAAILDGKHPAAVTTTSVASASVRSRYKTGPTPGFRISVPVSTGRHTVCIVARNTGAGLNTVLGCVVTPWGTKLTSAQRAAHSPRGAILARSAGRSSVRFQGWATDPDYTARRAMVVLYLDNRSAATVNTAGAWSPRATGAGARSKFDITVPAASGAHVGCVWAVNIGIGSNRLLGCSTVDTRGGAASGAVPRPSLNAKVAVEAKKHIGQPYVWGAVGPKRFDCSGLVQYSYRKFGKSVPRVSQDQFRAARLIPASRAVAGDPVFYFDNTGDVFHVGIYLGPGRTVAAIDEAEGVNYQRIWDPSHTAYGSFTHT